MQAQLQEGTLMALCRAVQEVLLREGTVVDVSAPVAVCGDIHGQLFDLWRQFDAGKPLEPHRALFYRFVHSRLSFRSILFRAICLGYNNE